MFPKPKYADPSQDLRNFVIVSMIISFFPHFLFLVSNVGLEKVNPLLCHILLQKHFYFEMFSKKNAYSKSTIEPLEIDVKYIQS